MATTTGVLEEMVAGSAPGIVRLTVDQFHRMVELGILSEGDAVELIEGVMVQKDRDASGGEGMVHGPRHALGVVCLQQLASRVEPLGAHVRSQLPLTLSPTDEPEPDLAVVRGVPRDYLGRHPGPADTLLVVEVADHSLAYDRSAKLRLYARAGVPLYWILNLVEGHLETYEEPMPGSGRYDRRVDHTHGDVITLRLPPGALDVAVAEILPSQTPR